MKSDRFVRRRSRPQNEFAERHDQVGDLAWKAGDETGDFGGCQQLSAHIAD